MCLRYLLLFILIFVAVGHAQVGYRLHDSNTVFEMYNEIDSYFFDVESKIQLTNHKDDYWSHNKFCFGYDQGGWKYRCFDNFSSVNWFITTDNETYVNVTVWKNINVMNREVRLALRYHLSSYDTRLTATGYIKNIGTLSINVPIGFSWVVTNIRINMTENWDFAEIWIYNQTTHTYHIPYPINETHNVTTNSTKYRYYLNETINKFWNNNELYEGTIDIRDTEFNEISGNEESLQLWWNKNLNGGLWLTSENNTENETVRLLINVGTLAVGQSKQTDFFWHDFPERGSCACSNPLASGGITASPPFITESVTYSHYCWWGQIGLPCGFSCSLYWDDWYTDSGGVNYNVIKEDNFTEPFDYALEYFPLGSGYENPKKCTSGCLAFYDVKIGARADNKLRSRCQVGSGPAVENNYTVHDDDVPTAVIINHVDAELTDGGITIKCEANDSTQVRNVTLFSNITGTWHELFFRPDLSHQYTHRTQLDNFTYNLDGSTFESIIFGCRVQDGNASNGNIGFSDNLTINFTSYTNVTLILPSNSTEYEGSNAIINFQCIAQTNDGGFSNLSLIIDDSINQTYIPFDYNKLAGNSDFENNISGMFMTSSNTLDEDNMLYWWKDPSSTMAIHIDTDTNSNVVNISFDGSIANGFLSRYMGSPDWGATVGSHPEYHWELGTTYILSGLLKTEMTNGFANLTFDTTTGTDCGIYISNNTGWTYLECAFKIGASMSAERFNLVIDANTGNPNGSVYVDNLSIKRYNTTQTHFDTATYMRADTDENPCDTADECDENYYGVARWERSENWIRVNANGYSDNDYVYCGFLDNCDITIKFINLTGLGFGDGIYDLYGMCWDTGNKGLNISANGDPEQDWCDAVLNPDKLYENLSIFNGTVDIRIRGFASSFYIIDDFRFVPKRTRPNFVWFADHTFEPVNVSNVPSSHTWTCNFTKADSTVNDAPVNWIFSFLVEAIFNKIIWVMEWVEYNMANMTITIRSPNLTIDTVLNRYISYSVFI